MAVECMIGQDDMDRATTLAGQASNYGRKNWNLRSQIGRRHGHLIERIRAMRRTFSKRRPPAAMPRHWDHHYANPDGLDFTPSPLLVEAAGGLPPGCALDLACGHGRNTIYLAGLGWRVTAVDRSPAAIRLLRERSSGMDVDPRVADLEAGEFPIPPASFELICDFLYLQRDLFPQIREGIRSGGLFVGAIHLFDRAAAPGRNPAFQLQPGELREEFAGWKVLFYSEGVEPGRTRPSARIVARKA